MNLPCLLDSQREMDRDKVLGYFLVSAGVNVGCYGPILRTAIASFGSTQYRKGLLVKTHINKQSRLHFSCKSTSANVMPY